MEEHKNVDTTTPQPPSPKYENSYTPTIVTIISTLLLGLYTYLTYPYGLNYSLLKVGLTISFVLVLLLEIFSPS